MTSTQVRASFVRFFESKGHVHAPGASLVPDAHATTLFTIAGMEPFVPVFLGRVPPPAPRVVTVQPCLRVAGAKNDIESVGRTGRHATLLEMLGNFSFGDYYKREAIGFAWEYLTKELGLDGGRLWPTVYLDDDEAAGIWRSAIGVPAERIARFGPDNFWDMGPTGPCGPCSEIFYDLGPGTGCGKPACGVGCVDCESAPHGARFIEVWNLVFQQYDRDASGTLHPLPTKCIDTGMGLERLCMVLAGATSIFDTDLFADVVTALPPARAKGLADDDVAAHRRIIADHARAVTFLIADGVWPSNTDRGYVLRFLIRRAIRSGKLVGMADGFLARLVPAVVGTLAAGYPRLREAQPRIAQTLQAEEQLFERTMEAGAARIKALIAELPSTGARVIGGADVFKMHDTYGFPPELTEEAAREAGAEIDLAGYRAAMAEQRERARADSRAKRAEVRVEGGAGGDLGVTTFEGYDSLEGRGTVIALFDDAGSAVRALDAGRRGVVVLDRTPFYAERGGQMGDRGALTGTGMTFSVDDTYYADKTYRTIMHAGDARDGPIAVGDVVEAIVDPAWRREVRRHHSVTHLLQRALKDVVGEVVAQRGSQVYADRTRFDFDAPGALSREQRAQVGARVNDLIRSDFHGTTQVMPFDEAVARGAIYMKGENYGGVVRVVTFGPSIELCGGTHVTSTGEIGHFVLLSESAIAAGVRRVEGLVSEAADTYDARVRDEVDHVGALLSVGRDQVAATVERLARERRELEKKVAALQAEVAAVKAGDLVAGAREAAGVPYLTVRAPGTESEAVRGLVKTIRERWPSGVLVVAAGDDGRVTLHVSVSADLEQRGMSARDLLNELAPHVGGKGGGNAAQAQGGGTKPAGIDDAFAALPLAIERYVVGPG